MKLTLLLALVLTGISFAFAEPIGIYQHGTVVRMHMGDCSLMHRGFASTFGPAQATVVEDSCPEYTLLTDKVVYLIVGKSSNQLVPLAETIDFRFEKKELLVRVDDARHESKFAIKEMTLRSEWELIQKHIEEQLRDSHHAMETSMAMRNQEER